MIELTDLDYWQIPKRSPTLVYVDGISHVSMWIVAFVNPILLSTHLK